MVDHADLATKREPPLKKMSEQLDVITQTVVVSTCRRLWRFRVFITATGGRKEKRGQ